MQLFDKLMHCSLLIVVSLGPLLKICSTQVLEVHYRLCCVIDLQNCSRRDSIIPEHL